MFKEFLIVSLTITYCYADNLNGASGLDRGFKGGYRSRFTGGLGKRVGTIGEYGLGNRLGRGLALNLNGDGLGLGNGALGLSYGGNGYSSSPGAVHAAIQSRRTYQVIPVASHQEPAVPQTIEVEPSEQPVQIVFRSLSSPVHVQQIHTPGAPGQVESTHSEDEPHRVLHEVLRPVIQEVREVIQPYRRVTQEVRPVLEDVHTVVSKGERHSKNVVVDSEIIDEYSNYGPASGLDLGSRGLSYGEGRAVLESGHGLGNSALKLSYDKGGYAKAAKKAA